MKHKLEHLFLIFNIKGLAFDSREVKNNYVFFAITGNKLNGNNYIKDAFNNGASLVITDNEQLCQAHKQSNIIFFPGTNIREVLAIAASIIYPFLPKYILAVTGTNGKTSVAHYVQQLIELLGHNAVSIGTLGVIGKDLNYLDDTYSSSLTTPDPITLHKILDKLAHNKVEYVIIEAASHGIEQKRLYGIEMYSCAFTSFSQDHLDYHKNLDDYLLAKLKLFSENLRKDGVAIVNHDMNMVDSVLEYIRTSNKKIITVGNNADVKIEQIVFNGKSNIVKFLYQQKKYKFKTNIIANYQIYNMLISVMLVNSLNFELDEVLKQVSKLRPPPGRLEPVDNNDNNNFQIFIDYAHTPDAIQQVLQELRKITKGKLKILFGCGGDRDSDKRKIMGQLASKFADEVIITDDNPRTEDPEFIRKQILSGTQKNAIEIPDRRNAIRETVLKLKKHDILLIAGKGHENYQIIGNKKLPFDDLLIAKQTIKQRYDME